MHPATKLLIARLESNPEEFWDDDNEWCKWNRVLADMEETAPEEYNTLVKPALYAARMEGIHRRIMRELLKDTGNEARTTRIRGSQILVADEMAREISEQLELALDAKPGKIL